MIIFNGPARFAFLKFPECAGAQYPFDAFRLLRGYLSAYVMIVRTGDVLLRRSPGAIARQRSEMGGAALACDGVVPRVVRHHSARCGNRWVDLLAGKRLEGHGVRQSAAVRADCRPHAGPTNLELCILKSRSPCGAIMNRVVSFDNFKA